MGLINEPKRSVGSISRSRLAPAYVLTNLFRVNVAITRAKELMIVIGNMNCHKVDRLVLERLVLGSIVTSITGRLPLGGAPTDRHSTRVVSNTAS